MFKAFKNVMIGKKNVILNSNGENETSFITAISIQEKPKTYYGAYVDYKPKNGCNVKWRIFYSDGKNIYIVAEQYVEKEYLIPTCLQTKYEYCICSTKSREDLIARLYDKSLYNDFKDTDGKAESVVGAMTIKLFVASYNDIYENKLNVITVLRKAKISKYGITDNMGKSYADGNFTRLSSNMESRDYATKLPEDTLTKNLYIPKKIGRVDGMWLASPSAYSKFYVMNIGYEGYIGWSGYSYLNSGIKPLVCLKPSVKIQQNEDGIYELR